MPEASSSSQAPVDAVAPQKKKRSLFKNVPSWSAKEIPSPLSSTHASPGIVGPSSSSKNTPQSTKSPLAQDDDFFNRSNETLRRYEENEKAPFRLKNDSSAIEQDWVLVDSNPDQQRDANDGNDLSPQKRRRLNDQPETTLNTSSSDVAQSHAHYDEVLDDIYSHPSEVRGASKSKPVEILDDQDEPEQGPSKPQPVPVTINLSDSEDDNSGSKPKVRSSASKSPALPSVETQPSNNEPNSPLAALPTSENIAAPTKEQTSPHPKPIQPPQHDPVLAILITSEVPHTEPLIIRRHYSQRLKEVRESWCKFNQLPQVQSDAIFLLWRGKRVFDISSCRVLGIRVNELGEVWINGQCQPAGPDGSQIQMEAVNKTILDEREREKKEQAQRALQAKEDDLEVGAPRPSAEPDGEHTAESDRAAKIRVLLRSKEFDLYKVIVKRATLVEKLIKAFLVAHSIPPDKTVSLMFEGEKLAPEQQLLDTDVQDKDFVDVYIK